MDVLLSQYLILAVSADARALPNYPRTHCGIENRLTKDDFNVNGSGLNDACDGNSRFGIRMS